MQTITAEWLKSIDALKDVPLAQLQWMIDNSRHYSLPEGNYLFKGGEPIVGTHILRAGKIRLYMLQNGEVRALSVLVPKDISGSLPFSRTAAPNVIGKLMEE